jgi:hypothetical protein
MNRAIALPLIGASLALGLSAQPAAAAKPHYVTGTFRVELEGVQKTTWEHKHEKQFECDSNSVGQGTETVRFRAKPVTAKISRFGSSAPLIQQGSHQGADLALRSKITRQGTLEDRGAEVCADGDGTGDTPPPPDCGTKSATLWANLDYASGRRDVIALDQSDPTPIGVFHNCPVGGTAFPLLLDRVEGAQIGRRLPARDLFSHGKHILIAQGREVSDTGEDRSTTTVRWTLSVTRVGVRKKG